MTVQELYDWAFENYSLNKEIIVDKNNIPKDGHININTISLK